MDLTGATSILTQMESVGKDTVVKLPKINVPNINIPEKIILCIDLCQNVNSHYKLGDGTTFTSMNMIKRVTDFFVHTKVAINSGTEFALVALRDKEVSWLHNFTTNLRDLYSKLDFLSEEASTTEEFDLALIFDALESKIDLPKKLDASKLLSMPHVYRVLLLYGRSDCIPKMQTDSKFFESIRYCPYFYVDILYNHEEDCMAHKCDEIYDNLQDLDNGYSFVFEVSHNATKMHDSIAKLLAHPLQRPLHKNASYNFGKNYT